MDYLVSQVCIILMSALTRIKVGLNMTKSFHSDIWHISIHFYKSTCPLHLFSLTALICKLSRKDSPGQVSLKHRAAESEQSLLVPLSSSSLYILLAMERRLVYWGNSEISSRSLTSAMLHVFHLWLLPPLQRTAATSTKMSCKLSECDKSAVKLLSSGRTAKCTTLLPW